jgi:5-methylthioadenosine/S-adenosylhomocysteine deaminase
MLSTQVKEAPMDEVEIIFTGGTVLTMDAKFRVYAPGAVAVADGVIRDVGTAEDVRGKYSAAETVDCSGQVVMPGLVNAHTHAPMALLRGLADDRRLDVWLMGYIMPVEREFVRDRFCWLGTQLACAEMISSGTTCFADMYYFEEAVADAASQAGLRAVCAQTVLRFPTPDALGYDAGLEQASDFISRWRGHPTITPAVGPHAPYSTTPELLAECTKMALEAGVPMHVHVAETASEVAEHQSEYGMAVVPWLAQQGVLEAEVTAAHCVHVSEQEMHILRDYSVGVSHNPTSNLKLASGIAPVAQMLDMGLNVGIGTDGPASNNDLDMWEEMRLAAVLSKGHTGDPTVVPARKALEMATIGGARALHLDDNIGSLEVGKQADIVVVDLRTVHSSPRFKHDPNGVYATLVYTSKACDVRHVMCHGKLLFRDQQLLTVDPDVLMDEARGIAERIDAFIVHREESVLQKLFAVGEVAQAKTFEVQVKVRMPHEPTIDSLLERPAVEIVKQSLRRQYDTYYLFDDVHGNRLRYREDELLDQELRVVSALYRLTLIGQTKEREFPNSVLLSRSRFDAPATRSERFYREYFQPVSVVRIHKCRRRFRIRYGGTDFAVNMDELELPRLEGVFVEVKSRTWSAQDAERKAELIGELLGVIGIADQQLLKKEYLQLAMEHGRSSDSQ